VLHLRQRDQALAESLPMSAELLLFEMEVGFTAPRVASVAGTSRTVVVRSPPRVARARPWLSSWEMLGQLIIVLTNQARRPSR
jgi:hypothetical protein